MEAEEETAVQIARRSCQLCGVPVQREKGAMTGKRNIRDKVRRRYADAAKRAAEETSSCCGKSASDGAIRKNLYEIAEPKGIPDAARLAWEPRSIDG